VSGNKRERGSIENLLLSFFFLPPSICFVFLKRDERGDVYVGVMMGKELEKCRESFFFSGHDRVRIYIHNLQCQCNLSLNCNEQYKEEIDHDSSKL